MQELGRTDYTVYSSQLLDDVFFDLVINIEDHDGGIAFGLVLGWLVCSYFGKFGFAIGDIGVSKGMLFGDRIYAILSSSDVVSLTIIAFVVTMVASLYPAILAARLEPVDALHGK